MDFELNVVIIERIISHSLMLAAGASLTLLVTIRTLKLLLSLTILAFVKPLLLIYFKESRCGTRSCEGRKDVLVR